MDSLLVVIPTEKNPYPNHEGGCVPITTVSVLPKRDAEVTK